MKVSEAIDILKRYPKDCEIYLCKDWEQLDENGKLICPNLIYLYRLQDVTIAETDADKVIILCNANVEPIIIY